MDLEEFLESDVIFSLDYSLDHLRSHDNGNYGNGNRRRRYGQWKSSGTPRYDEKKEKQQRMSSPPVSIPVNVPAVTAGCCRYDNDVAETWRSVDQSSDDDDDGEMMERLPPHLIVERRVSGEIARSFSPLKGRNLSQVRNSVLRMTGFLER